MYKFDDIESVEMYMAQLLSQWNQESLNGDCCINSVALYMNLKHFAVNEVCVKIGSLKFDKSKFPLEYLSYVWNTIKIKDKCYIIDISKLYFDKEHKDHNKYTNDKYIENQSGYFIANRIDIAYMPVKDIIELDTDKFTFFENSEMVTNTMSVLKCFTK